MRKANLSHLFKHFTPESRVVMRADFNVPIKDKKIADPNRIISTVYDMQALYLQSKKLFSKNLNHSFCCHIMVDLMDRESLKIRSGL